jgi:hypothetical protein
MGANESSSGGSVLKSHVPRDAYVHDTEERPREPHPSLDDDVEERLSALQRLPVVNPNLIQQVKRAPRRPQRSKDASQEQRQRELRELARLQRTRAQHAILPESSSTKSPARSRSGSPRARLHHFSDDECADGDSIEVDGIIGIQSALNSDTYTDKMKDRFLQIRARRDTEWRHMGGTFVDSFYSKMNIQDVQASERDVVSPTLITVIQIMCKECVRASLKAYDLSKDLHVVNWHV